MPIRWLFLLLAFGLLSVRATSAEPVQLSEVVREAIDSHPDINATWQDLQSARQDTKVARSGYRPTVDLTARSALVRRNSGLDQSYSDSEVRLTATQMLFDGFFTSSEIKRLESAQKVRYLELLNQVELISLEVATAFADMLLYRELLRVAEDNLRTHVDVYKQIEKSAQAGVARRADLEQISGRLYLAESNVMTEQSNLHDVASRYQRLTGKRPPDELAGIDDLIYADLPASVADSLMVAYQYNPGFLATWYNIRSNQFSIDSAQSRYLPTVNLVGSYGTQTRDQAGLDNTITEGRVGIEVNYNFYNGGADRAQIKSALALKDQALDLRDRSCRDVRQTVQIAFNDIRNLDRQLPALNEHRLSASRVRTAYLDQFKIGERTLLDLLDSENEAYESGRAYTEALYTQYKAVLRLLAGSGKLAEFLAVTRSDFNVTEAIRLSGAVYDPKYVCPAESTDVMSQETNILVRDSDGDGVTDLWDECPDTPANMTVDDFGCHQEIEEPMAVDPFGDEMVEESTPTVTEPTPLLEPELRPAINAFFAENDATLSEEQKVALQPVVDFLNESPSNAIQLYGHASLKGNRDYNQALSLKRAQNVADWLATAITTEGLESRFSVIALGEDSPAIDNNTDAADQANRRVEIRFINNAALSETTDMER